MPHAPRAYYNEFDPYAAQWLRNLIAAGHIAPGDVDERSIVDVQPDDLRGYTQCHFFAGIGGWSLAARLAGWPDDRPLWTGSCPCQPWSSVGKRNGFSDERHLWPEMFRLVRECRPGAVFGEQVATSALAFQWLDAVFDDMEAEGYACWAANLGASSVGLPMDGPRLFWVSVLPTSIVGVPGPSASVPTGSYRQEWPRGPEDLLAVFRSPMEPGERHPQPIIRLDHDGLPPGVVKARTKAAGNAIVPQVAAHVIRAVIEGGLNP